MIAFSFVLMSRSRSQMFSSLCESIKNTSLLNNEIVVGLDDDDPELETYTRSIQNINNCKTIIEPRNSNLHIRLNSLINYVSGKYIFVLNDDCLLTNKGWDSQAYSILNTTGDIVYGKTIDNSIDRVADSYAAFPIISTFAAKTIGFIMDDTYGNHGSDVITYRIYNQANKVVALPMVLIDHIFHNSQESLINRQKDKTAVDMINRTFSKRFDINELFRLDVTEKAQKIRNK